MQKDSTWKDSSASLLSFYNASVAGNFNKLSSVESSLNEGNAAAAYAVLSGLTSSGNIETNFINFYQAYIDYLNGNYTSTDSLAVITLAQACPATDGSVVFQARAFYNSLYAIHKHFDNNCNYGAMPPSARMAEGFGKDGKVFPNEDFFIFPNPSTGTIYISGGNSSDKEWTIEVTDVTGRVLLKQTVPVNKGVAVLNADLPPGAYFLMLKGSYGNDVTKKVMIAN